jgi:hypothetical protein
MSSVNIFVMQSPSTPSVILLQVTQSEDFALCSFVDDSNATKIHFRAFPMTILKPDRCHGRNNISTRMTENNVASGRIAF